MFWTNPTVHTVCRTEFFMIDWLIDCTARGHPWNLSKSASLSSQYGGSAAAPGEQVWEKKINLRTLEKLCGDSWQLIYILPASFLQFHFSPHFLVFLSVNQSNCWRLLMYRWNWMSGSNDRGRGFVLLQKDSPHFTRGFPGDGGLSSRARVSQSQTGRDRDNSPLSSLTMHCL